MWHEDKWSEWKFYHGESCRGIQHQFSSSTVLFPIIYQLLVNTTNIFWVCTYFSLKRQIKTIYKGVRQHAYMYMRCECVCVLACMCVCVCACMHVCYYLAGFIIDLGGQFSGGGQDQSDGEHLTTAISTVLHSHTSLSTPIHTYNFLNVPFDNFPPLVKSLLPIHPVCLLQAIWLLYPLCSSNPKTNLSCQTQSNEKE